MEAESYPNCSEFEEGEVAEDDSDLYTPLERPHIQFSTGREQLSSNVDSDDDNKCKESSDDSDSSTERYAFKRRKKNLPNNFEKMKPKKKNYNIWSSDIQAEVLMNSLVDCNVDKANIRTRDVESYNYHLGLSNKHNNAFENNESTTCRQFGKRKSGGKFIENGNNHNKFEKKDEKKESKGCTRCILSLSTTVDNTEGEIATDIANKLVEKKEDLILRALQILGKAPVISLFEETREIEMSGGLLIMNGTRRRTPGGVFFYLLKTSNTLPRDKINEVFNGDKKATSKNQKRKARKMKTIRAAKFKEALAKDDFPTLLSRTELAIKEFKAKRLAGESSEVLNPPPSPANDERDCGSRSGNGSDGDSDSDSDDQKNRGDGENGRDENIHLKISTDNCLPVYDDMFD